MARRWLRVAAWSFAGLILSLILLIIAVQTPPARRFVLQRAIELLRKQGVEFDATQLNYNLLALSADLQSVVVRSPQAPDLPPLLSADRVHVDLSLSKVIRGKYHLEDGEVVNPRLNFVIDENGRDNVPRPPKEDESSSEINYLVDRFRISGGSLRYEDRRQKIVAEVPLQSVDIDGNELTGNHDVLLTAAEGGFVSLDTRKANLEALSADVQLEKQDAVQIRRLQLDLTGAKTEISGRVDNFKDPRFDVKGTAALALEPLAQVAQAGEPVRGNVNLALTATGPLNAIRATARVDGQQIAARGFERVTLNADTAYDAAASRVRLNSLEIRSPQGTVQGSANVALNAAAGESTAAIRCSAVDLAQISSTLKLPVRILSNVTAELSARWPGLTWEQATGAGKLNLQPTSATPTQNAIPVGGSAGVEFQGIPIQGTGSLNVNIVELTALNARVTGQLTTQNREQLGGRLRLEAPNIASTVSGAEAFLGRQPGTLLGTPIQGSLAMNVTPAGTLQRPTAITLLTAPNLTVGTLSGIDLEAAAAYNPDLLTLQQLTARWQQQEARIFGTVGLMGDQPLSLTASAPNISIDAIRKALNQESVDVTGTLALTADVRGTVKQPEATAELSGSDLVAYKEPLGMLDLKGRYQNGLAELSSLTVERTADQGGGSLAASGTYQPDTHQYTVKLQSNNLALKSLTLPNGDPARATIQTLEATGQGTIENPGLDAHLVANNILIKDRDLGLVDLTAKGVNRQVDLQANAAKFGLDAKATIGTEAPYPSTFEVNARNTDLANLPSVPEGLAGTISAAVRGSGPLQEIERATADAEVSSVNLTWRASPIRNDGPIQAHYENRTVTVNRAVIVASGSRAEISGTVPIDENGPEASLNLNTRIDLATLPMYLPPEQGITAQGTATIAGTVRGNLKRIVPDITVALENGQFSTTQMPTPVTNANLQARVADGVIALEKASAVLGPATLNASGTIPLGLIPGDLPVEIPRQQGPAQFRAELQKVDLSTVAGLPKDLKGTVSANFEATASRPEPEAIEGTLTFPDLNIAIGNYALQQEGTSTIALNKGALDIRQFKLTGPMTEFTASGTANLLGNRELNVKLGGNLDASVSSIFTEAVRATGPAELHATVTGTVTQPQAAGYVQLTDAQVSVDTPRLGVTNLNLRADLAGTQATISRLEGDLNGGSLSGKGTLGYANGKLEGTDVTVSAKGVYLDFPQGLRTISDLSIRAASADDRLNVTGEVSIQEGGFTDDLNLDQGILAALTAPAEIEETQERSPLVESVQFGINIKTQSPLVVDNNLAKVEVTMDARLVGNPYEPGMDGKLEIIEGGEIRLQERRYAVDRGLIYFVNDRRIEPSLDIAATTSVGGYDIRLQIQGSPGMTDTVLTSDPSLPEPDILALLITGKTADEIRGEEFQVARNQVLSYLAGRVGSTVGQRLQQATGLSTVRLEPNLIAAETDPSARLTVGQKLTPNLNFVYSMDLINSSDQIWTTEYDFTKRFNSRVVRQSDGSFRLDFRHDLRFGGDPEPRRGEQRNPIKIANISITGNGTFPHEQILKKLKVDAGDKYNFFKLRKGLDRIQAMYSDKGLYEAYLRLKREQKDDNTVDLTLQVRSGPKVEFVFEGANVPGKVRDRVREIWIAGVFDGQRLEDSVLAIRDWLIEDGYVQAKVESMITPQGAEGKRVLFDIQPGAKFTNVELVFNGAKGIEQSELRDVVKSQKLSKEVYTKPGRVTELLRRFYREKGYLDAEAGDPQYELDPAQRRGRVVFPVKEGPQYRIGMVTFEGNTVFTPEKLGEEIPLPRDEAYRPILRENALERLRELYYRAGYNDVTAEFRTRRNSDAGRLDVTFEIIEGPRSVVREVKIEGNRNVSENLIGTQVSLQPGDPVDFKKLGDSRRNLYNTGAFATVEILREELPHETGTKEMPTRLRVVVREIQPFEFRYGAFFDTERGPGVILDFSNRNSLGSARVLGLRSRYDRQLMDTRVYFSQPTLRRFPLKTIGGPYVRYERNPATSETDAFNVDRYGFSVQQEARLLGSYVLNYGYRFERSRTYDPGPDPFFDVTLKVASLTTTASRDTRDELLDATRGSFISHAMEYSTPKIGSDLSFIKYFGQYFKYVPLQKPRIELFTNKVIRPRLVYAGGVRVGLARGFGGQEVPRSERFFAGGATTIRGFEQNTVGEIVARQPSGGQALLIINNEIRFPMISIFDGAGFLDVGNVYPHVTDLSLTDIRKVAGFGIRARTPWFLLRVDYGVKLDRRPEETMGRFFFSIGQAF